MDSIHFVDNFASCSCLLNGYCKHLDCAVLVHYVSIVTAFLNIVVFWDWVPSKANPGDNPSRLDYDLGRYLGAYDVLCAIPTARDLMGKFGDFCELYLNVEYFTRARASFTSVGFAWFAVLAVWRNAQRRIYYTSLQAISGL